MKEHAAVRHPRTARWGWGILVALSGLLILNGILLYFVIVQTPQEQTLAILLTGFGSLALVVALEGFRRGGEGALRGMWVMVALLFVLVLHMARIGRMDVAVFYLILGALALTGQLLARGLAPSRAASALSKGG
jgi:hypothetical protein